MTNTNTERPATRRGPAEYFSGTVWIDDVMTTPAEMGVVIARVTFEPGARTAWHTHPLGQILVVESGVGRAQAWGGPVHKLSAGDSVYFAPGVKHWHGAASDRMMVHLAIQRADAVGRARTGLSRWPTTSFDNWLAARSRALPCTTVDAVESEMRVTDEVGAPDCR